MEGIQQKGLMNEGNEIYIYIYIYIERKTERERQGIMTRRE